MAALWTPVARTCLPLPTPPRTQARPQVDLSPLNLPQTAQPTAAQYTGARRRCPTDGSPAFRAYRRHWTAPRNIWRVCGPPSGRKPWRLTMATVAEQWVLVEMVQALYEVSLAAPGVHDHTQRWGSGTFCVEFWSEAWAGLARLCPDPRRPSLERLIGAHISQWRNVGRHGREPEPGGLVLRCCEHGALSRSCPDTGERLVKNKSWDWW